MQVTWRQYTKLLSTYLCGQWWRVAILAVLLLLGIGLQLVNPQILRNFIDGAKAGTGLPALMTLAWIFLAVSIIDQICTAIVAYLGADISWIATNRLREDMAQQCLRLDMPFHHTHTPGEIIERVEGDVNTLSSFFGQFMVSALRNMLLLIGVLVMLGREDWRVGVILGGFALVAMVAMALARNFMVPAMKAEREIHAEMSGFVEERLGGLEDIRANGIGAYTMHSFAKFSRRFYTTVITAWQARNYTWLFMTTFFLAGNLIALIMGAYLFQQQMITLGTVYLILHYTMMLRNPLEQLTRQLQELQQAGASILRINELMGMTSAIQDGVSGVLPAGAPAVDFADVTFAYHEGEPVLHDLSLRLEPGRVLGVLGRTGSGKTTMMRLLFRLYDMQQGAIRLGDMDIRDVPLADLRRHIGMVTQDVQLFHASVRDNLTFFDQSISDDRILQVIGELGLQEWLDALPKGLDTVLQVGGSGLSAGESQLLAFTRVFLENPGLVLLDEPSSRLDPATERLIGHAVDKLLHDRTCIIIAHRLGTVRRVDEILILDDGRIVEHGPRQALADNAESRFAALLRTGMEKELV